ncbi:Hypothetical protein SMAX5B_006928, partial [Scophthalmus maximus]
MSVGSTRRSFPTTVSGSLLSQCNHSLLPLLQPHPPFHFPSYQHELVPIKRLLIRSTVASGSIHVGIAGNGSHVTSPLSRTSNQLHPPHHLTWPRSCSSSPIR